MTIQEMRDRALDKSYAAYLAYKAHTGDHKELQAEADAWTALADATERLQELEASKAGGDHHQ